MVLRKTAALAALSLMACSEARPWVIFSRPRAEYGVLVTACDGEGRSCLDMQVAEVFSPTDTSLRRVLGLEVDPSSTSTLSLQMQLGDGSGTRCDRLELELGRVGSQVDVTLTPAPPAQPGLQCAEGCQWRPCVQR
jgi:hypothetical protein